VELWMQKVPMTSGPGTLTVTVDQEPVRAGIDPYHFLVDRNIGDNVTRTTEAKGGV
jgi:ABC-2 type transport system permease protein